MPDPLEAVRGDVQPQPSQALAGLERQGAQTVAALVGLGAAGHLTVLQRHAAVVGNGHPMGRAGEVREDGLGLRKRVFRVHAPCLGAPVGEQPLPGGRLGQLPPATRPGQLAWTVEVLQPRQGEWPKASREDADGQEAVRPPRDPRGPGGRQASRGEEPRQMGMMVQWLAPGVQHGEAADRSPEMLRVPSDILERRRHGAQEPALEVAGALQHQRPEGVRQSTEHMTVGGLEECLRSGGEPRRLGRAMPCGAAAGTARVVCLHGVPTVGALGDVASQGGRATSRARAGPDAARPRGSAQSAGGRRRPAGAPQQPL
jgi:hypothetical protein